MQFSSSTAGLHHSQGPCLYRGWAEHVPELQQREGACPVERQEVVQESGECLLTLHTGPREAEETVWGRG